MGLMAGGVSGETGIVSEGLDKHEAVTDFWEGRHCSELQDLKTPLSCCLSK
jgi:hypothetical protein